MWTFIGIIAIIVLYIVSVYNALGARRAQIKMVKKSILKNIQNAYILLHAPYTENDLIESIDEFKKILVNNPNNAELDTIKDKIKSDIEFYNKLCRGLNSQLEIFPTNLIAQWFHFIPQAIITNGDF